MSRHHPIHRRQAMLLLAAIVLTACAIRPANPPSTPPPIGITPLQTTPQAAVPSETPPAVVTRQPTHPADSAAFTPDTRAANLPDLSNLGEGWYPLWYVLQPGEDLGIVAGRFGLTYDQMRAANRVESGQILLPGQTIIVPQQASRLSPAALLIPDSELVYGPAAVDFDIAAAVAAQHGYLSTYTEPVGGVPLSGAEVVERVAANYSVNPRLLLALLEYHSGWLTSAETPDAILFPLAHAETGAEGLYAQLVWAATQLNDHFYSWRTGRLSLILLDDGTRVGLHPDLNAGTAAVQALLAQTHTAEGWPTAFEPGGLADVYNALFGDPFSRTVELLPPDLTQPDLALPWAAGETWYYAGGPHPAYGSGSAWGAVDFAPPGGDVGCYVSERQIRAAAAGLVARTDFGQVVLDVGTPLYPADGYEQTGWALVYLHVENRSKAGVGLEVERGGFIGLPSCDGGEAEGTHLHLARKYNGLWLRADDVLPFEIGGWQVLPGSAPYEGQLLSLGDDSPREACDCRNDEVNGVFYAP